MTNAEKTAKGKILYSRYKQLCKKHHVTTYAILKKTMLDLKTLLEWKIDGITPKRCILQSLADYFCIPINRFTQSDDL